MYILSDQQLEGLLSFIGYGNPQGRLRFVGFEEGLGGAMDTAEQAENLIARCSWKPIVDMRSAHLTLKERGEYIDISRSRRGSTLVWRFMSRFARAVLGHPNYSDATLAKEYMHNLLGRAGSDTFLTEISPVPAAAYSSREQPSRQSQLAADLLSNRRKRQLEILSDTRGITICYGLSKKADFARHLGIEWVDMGPDNIFSVSKDGSFFLTPFLGQGQMSVAKVSQLVSSPQFQSAISRSSATPHSTTG